MLGMSVRSLDYYIAYKQIQVRRNGGKVLIPYGELVRFAKSDHLGPIAKAA